MSDYANGHFRDDEAPYIGKIVSSSSHVDYVCQIHGPKETVYPPSPQDYGFGTFVGIEDEEDGHLVGVIQNTTLMNPEFGNLGPRLSPQEDLAVFTPDYLAEKVILVALAVLGTMDGRGEITQGVPTISATLDARVRRLTPQEICDFHRTDSGLGLAYLPVLLAMGNPLAPYLIDCMIDQVCTLFPEEKERLTILASHLAWRSRVESIG